VHVVLGDSAIVHDSELTRRLADWLQEQELARPAIADGPVDVPIAWGHNQAAMLRRSRS